MHAILNVDVFTGERTLLQHAIIINGQRIVDIIPTEEASHLTDTIDGTGLLACAGFIDLQINGCGGVLLNTAITADTLKVMNDTNLAHGTTQFLPTLITCCDEDRDKTLELYSQLKHTETLGLLGLHLEGPYINPQKKGAHVAAYIKPLTDIEAKQLAAYSDSIRIITLAPECTPQSAIDILHQVGITVAVGHSHASYASLAEKHNISMATHLFNAMTPLTSREPGVVGYALNNQLYCGIIADGIHVAYPSISIAKQQLGDKLFLVTDAVTPAGTAITRFDMAGIPALVSDGKCHYEDGTIAGSTLTMHAAISNCITHLGIDQEEALRMASLYPAQAIGIDDQYGRLLKGYMANITLLDRDNAIQSVYQMGIRRI